MFGNRLDVDALLKATEQELGHIASTTHTLDVANYLQKMLPIHFPNKGLIPFIEKGALIEIHHELLNTEKLLKEIPIGELEALVDQYGSTHQRDYCYLVVGHRFDRNQSVQFRGVLGYNRLYKVILMLRLAGFSQAQLRVVDHSPDYRSIVRDDLRGLSDTADVVLVGGEVVVGPFLPKTFAVVRDTHGAIVSFRVYRYKGKHVLLSSFPYGDLCGHVVEELIAAGIYALAFIGSTAALSERLGMGDIVAPRCVFDDAHRAVTRSFSNTFAAQLPGVRVTDSHGTVITPLVETRTHIADMRERKYETIDVEASYFQKACEANLFAGGKVGILLYVVDRPGSPQTLAEHDYAADCVVRVRRQIASMLDDCLACLEC